MQLTNEIKEKMEEYSLLSTVFNSYNQEANVLQQFVQQHQNIPQDVPQEKKQEIASQVQEKRARVDYLGDCMQVIGSKAQELEIELREFTANELDIDKIISENKFKI